MDDNYLTIDLEEVLEIIRDLVETKGSVKVVVDGARWEVLPGK